MFHIHYDGTEIGSSALERGDPPMGCAEGLFIPSADYEAVRNTVSAEVDADPAIKRWIGLSVTTGNGVQIDCVDVVLFEFDFGDEKDLVVDVLGIGFPPYEELFPGRYAAYVESLRTSDRP